MFQIRHYSDGRKAFFQSIYDNMKEGFSKDKQLNVSSKPNPNFQIQLDLLSQNVISARVTDIILN